MKKEILILLNVFYLIYSQTNDQIKQAKNLIKNSGMSETEIKSVARAQGYSDQQIENAALKIGRNSISNNQNDMKTDNSMDIQNEQIANEQSLILSNDLTEQSANNESQIQSIDETTVHFGYDIFNGDPALFQATSAGAVDPNYLIGPGDEIIVMLWGETQFRQVLTVDREGFVFIPEVGQVFVNGLNLNLLESKLFRVLSQSYASLNPQNRKPTTFIDVSLGNLRPLRIQVLGEVAQPGAYTVSPSATIFSALYYFNGPTNAGSLRDIRLIRNGKEIVSIDFYDYLLTGKKPKDQKLLLDDVIFIPKRLKTVNISGQVKRPGVFEMKPNESLIDLISMAGDLSVTAYLNRAQIDRIVPFNKRNELGMDRMVSDVDLKEIIENDTQYPLQDGDKIEVFSVLDGRDNVVNLTGAVTRPGSYELEDSLSLSQLILKAGGLLGQAFKERADIVRINPDIGEELIKINLENILDKDSEDDILLRSLDQITIHSKTEMISRRYVSIAGHVKNAGTYDLLDNMKIYDLLFISDGYIDDDWLKQTYLARADLIRFEKDKILKRIIPFNLGQVLDDQSSKHNFLLESGDEIRVYSKNVFNANRNTTISGSVRNPGEYSLKKDMTVKDLILEAGGVSEDVFRYKIEIARIDPEHLNDKTFAEIINLEMDNDYTIRNIRYSYGSKEDKIMLERKSYKLKPYDFVSVRPDPFFRMQQKVTVQGAVYYPGVYVLNGPFENLTNIINRSGGLRPKAFPKASKLTRNGVDIRIDLHVVIKNPKSKENIYLQNGDSIFIAQKPDMTIISGEIVSPGVYKFLQGKRVNDYISMAGGYTINAEKKEIWITFPNGESKKYHRWVSNPKVLDGSIITIGQKEEQEPFDSTEFAKEIASILADFAQVLVLVTAINI